MNKEEFMYLLDDLGYPFKVQGERVIVGGGIIRIDSEVIYDQVSFENWGWVRLNFLKGLPEGVRFNNKGNVWINGIEKLNGDYQFDCRGNVIISGLLEISGSLRFNNTGGHVWIENLYKIDGELFFNHEITDIYCNSYHDFDWCRLKGVSLGRAASAALRQMRGI
jgi:hypothetical protein